MANLTNEELDALSDEFKYSDKPVLSDRMGYLLLLLLLMSACLGILFSENKDLNDRVDVIENILQGDLHLCGIRKNIKGESIDCRLFKNKGDSDER